MTASPLVHHAAAQRDGQSAQAGSAHRPRRQIPSTAGEGRSVLDDSPPVPSPMRGEVGSTRPQHPRDMPTAESSALDTRSARRSGCMSSRLPHRQRGDLTRRCGASAHTKVGLSLRMLCRGHRRSTGRTSASSGTVAQAARGTRRSVGSQCRAAPRFLHRPAPLASTRTSAPGAHGVGPWRRRGSF